jgi:hypothetical protein
MQTSIIAGIVPGHHHVLHILILHYLELACHQLSNSPHHPEATAVKITTYLFPEGPVAWHLQESRQHVAPEEPQPLAIGSAVLAARRNLVPGSCKTGFGTRLFRMSTYLLRRRTALV